MGVATMQTLDHPGRDESGGACRAEGGHDLTELDYRSILDASGRAPRLAAILYCRRCGALREVHTA